MEKCKKQNEITCMLNGKMLKAVQFDGRLPCTIDKEPVGWVKNAYNKGVLYYADGKVPMLKCDTGDIVIPYFDYIAMDTSGNISVYAKEYFEMYNEHVNIKSVSHHI